MRRSPKQLEAWRLLQDRSKSKILMEGGARSGKTFILCLWCTAICESYPNASIGVFRKYRRSCQSSVVKSFQQVLRGRTGWSFNKAELSFTYANGASIAFYGTSDDGGERLLGLELSVAWCNEITEIDQASFNIILSRLSSTATPCRKIVGDCNPKNLGSWVYKFFRIKQTEDGTPLSDADSIASLTFLPQDNTFLPADVLKSLSNLTGVSRERLYLGTWKDNEGIVYDEFQASTHTFNGIPEQIEIVGGVDFGFTNPFCILFAYVSGDGEVFVFDEIYKRETLIKDHITAIKQKASGRKVKWLVCDSENAENIATMRREGLPVFGTNKREMGVLDGILKVKEYLKPRENGKPRLYVHATNCPNLLRELQTLTWKTGKDETVGEDHAADALRYIIQHLQRPTYTGAGGVARR